MNQSIKIDTHSPKVVQLEHIIKTCEAHRLESGLWKSDIFVKDKQNVKAATRILSTSVQQCLATWNYQRTISTQTYLKIGQNMLSAFTEPNISIRQRMHPIGMVSSVLPLTMESVDKHFRIYKWSECCRVPCVCYSESTLHFPSNYHSVIFPFGCTGECFFAILR